jgi:hypothetical protein
MQLKFAEVRCFHSHKIIYSAENPSNGSFWLANYVFAKEGRRTGFNPGLDGIEHGQLQRWLADGIFGRDNWSGLLSSM